MLLVCRFDVPGAELVSFTARVRTAVELLSAQPGCTGATAGRSVDDDGTVAGGVQQWSLVARFESVTAYRRALSPFPVREHVVPLLATCRDDGPTTFEVLLDGVAGAVAEPSSLLAPDATTVGRGGNGVVEDR